MAFALTEEQSAAVKNRGGGLLVSAAAGSGKTRVLVERLLDHIVREGGNVDEFLVITYTRAAAAELRGRIAESLGERLAEDPKNAHLRRQTALVYKAGISTIHAFCADFLRECGHLLDLNPDFRLCDEGEAGVLMSQTLNDVLDRRYEDLQLDSAFAILVDTMSAGRDDSRLAQIVLDIYSRIQSHPDPRRWLHEQESTFRAEGITDAGETVWGGLLLTSARRQACYWQGKIAQALELTVRDQKLSQAYAPSLSVTMEGLAAFSKAAERGWDEAAGKAAIPFPRLGAVRGGCDDPNAQERIKTIRDKCKKRMEKIAELFRDDSKVLLEDLRLVYPAVCALLNLTADFADAYTAEKSRRGLLDFSDLEHFTLRLLVDERGEPTELAGEWGGRFTEIMVDEYQDTNEVQNAIFTALSRAGRNLFLVGDVKQSIYRFRLADPTIFLEKYRTFKYYTEAAKREERYITLSRNFRSRPEVLKSINDLFSDLMSAEFGEMDYTEKEALFPGGSFPDSGDYRTELDVLDCGEREEGELGKTDKNLMEARFAARRIRELTSGGLSVSDGEGGVRPARPEDVVILLRSPGPVLHHYARALSEQGLLWSAEGAEDFFAATEVTVALSLLQIVDNPRQDVALISALRSPVWGFSGDRLAQLRTYSGGDFYDAVQAAAKKEAGEDCRAFLAELDRLRLGAGDFSSHRLLWEIYERTNLLGIFGAMPDGQERQGNLLTLYELARRFEESGHRGLFGFLAHLSRLKDMGMRIVPPQTPGEGGGVSILSIHRSKGLEFPIVFVCGLERRFNRDDLKKPVLFHPKLGVGPKALDRERMIEYATLPRLAVAKQLESEMMAEELRLLYVAMTRAKEKLVLTYALSTGTGELRTLSADAGSPVEPQALLACSCVGQWVLLSAMSRPEASVLRESAGLISEEPRACSFSSEWDIRLTGGAAFEAPPKRRERAEEAETGEAPEDGELIRRLTWVNPNKILAEIPSKLTATQLKGRFMDEEAAQEAEAPKPRPPMSFHRPRFAAEELGLTAAQKGTALHLALQYMDFAKTSSAAEINEEIGSLAAKALLSPQQAEAISAEKLLAFFASKLGREILNARDLRREFKFSILVPAADYYPGAGGEERILLQGVIDCWFERADGLTVLDFKTDRVTEETVMERAEEYRPQLAAYGRALEEITGKRTARRILWFFALNRAVEL